MKKLLRLFMLAVLFLPFAMKSNAQNTLTVADGTTTNSNVPIHGLWADDYLRCQTIYPAAELDVAATAYGMNGGTITSITYYLSSPASNAWAGTWEVKITEVSATTLSAFVDMTNATTVYTGTLDGTQSPLTITFTTPYTYNGGNLLIEVNETISSNWSSASFYGVAATAASWQGYNSSSWSGITGSVQNFIPKTTFTFTGGSEITCSPVQNVAVDATQTTPNSLTLIWTDTLNDGATYSIYDLSDSSLIASGVTDTTYTIDNLESNTEYSFGIEANCSGSDASAIRVVNGHTACDAIATLPYNMGFESIDLQGTTSALLFPYCWTRINTLASSYYPYSYNSGTPHSGNRHLYFYASSYGTYGDTTGFIMPELDVATYPMNANRVTFWAKVTSTTDYSVQVGTMADPNDMATFTLIETVTVTGTDYTKYVVSLSEADATDAFVAFLVPRVNSTMYIDDVTLEEIPSCLEVTNLTVIDSLATTNSMTITWTDTQNPDDTYYTVYNMADTSDVYATITDNVAVIENLDANTVYTFGVQANCASGDAPFTTVSGRTACGTETMPWSENFDNWTSKSECWSFLSGAYNGGNGTPTESSSAWTLNSSYGSYITISGKALTMNVYSTNRYWAVTPPIEITDDNAMLSLDVAVAGWSSETPNYDANDTLAFAITIDDGATYNTLRVVTNTELNTLNGDYTTLYIPVTNYSGQAARFAIFAGSSASGGDNRIAIDNVTVSEPIDCLPVAGLSVSNITSTGATLTWEGDADGYTIYNMSDTTVDQYTTDITADLYALDPNTSYTFGVTANCGSEESIFRTVSFTTLVSCPAPTNLTATLTPGNGTVATLSWDNNGTEAWQICLNGDTNNLIDVTENPYELTDLTPETTYTAKVRAYCDVDDQSEWSDIITFIPTDAYMITVNDGTSTNNYVPIYGFWCDNITKSQFIIPAADLAAMQLGTINKLTFHASNNSVSWGAATFNVYLTTTNNTTLTELADYSNMTQVYAGSLSISDNKMEVTFTTPYLYTGGNLMVGFLQTLEGSYSSCSWYGVSATGASMGGYGTSISQRDFLPKTTIAFTPGEGDVCYPVTGLTADSVTANSVFLSWSDNNNIGVTYTIYDMSDSSVVASGLYDLEYEVTGLTGSTSYTFGVAANCSASDESYIATVNTTTDCESGSCQITIVGNDSYGDGWNGAAIAIVQGGITIGTFTLSSGNSLTQSFTVCSGAPVSFSWTPGSYPGETSFEIRNADNYTLYSASGSDISAGIFLTMSNACTSCVPVSALTVDATTSNSVTISWSGSADSYDVYNDETLVDNTVDTTYTFDNLTASSNYVFGVVANCSDGESSMMVTVAASTQCGSIDVFPYVQDFSTEPACWTSIDADGDGYNWALYGGAIQSASYDNSAGALTPDNWLVSPQFAIPATGNYEVTWAATAQDQSWPAEHYGVFVSTTGNTDTTDFTMLQEWTLSPGVFNPVIDLSTYTGQDIYIALRHWNCTDQFRLSIDEFTVREQAGANQVTINVGQNNPAYGTVTGAGIYNIGDNVTVSATAASGYTFSKWVDEDNIEISTDNPYTFVAATDLTLKAIFVDNSGTTYTITVEVNDSTMGTATGGGTYIAGEQITLSATAFAGYNFVNWTQESSFGTNVVGSEPDITISVTGDKTFIANFEVGSGPVVTDPTVTTNEATLVSQTTATLNGTINNPDNVTITAKGFEWKATASGTYTPVTVTGNTLTYNLDNLTANTGYTYKAFITFNGTTVYGDEVNFTTLEQGQLTEPSATTTPATNVTQTTATLNGTISNPDNVTITAQGFEWKAASASSYTVLNATGSTMSSTLNNLTANTNYTYRAFVTTANGTHYGSDVTFTTLEEIPEPCNVPTNLHTTTIQNEAIAIAWDADANVTSWNIQYRPVGGSLTTATSNTNSYTITGLTGLTTYEIQVQANCGDGNLSDWTAAITPQTTNVGIANYLENSVVLFPNPANEYINVQSSKVTVQSVEVIDVYGKVINTVNVTENPTRINVHGLASGMYFVRVTMEEGTVTKTFIKK